MIDRKPAGQKFGSQEFQITFMWWKVEFYISFLYFLKIVCTVTQLPAWTEKAGSNEVPWWK